MYITKSSGFVKHNANSLTFYNVDFPTSGYVTKNDLVGLAKLCEKSEDLETKETRENQQKKSDYASVVSE